MIATVLDRVRRALPAGGFGRALAIVAGGTAIGQVISLLAYPVLSRVCTPADFGILAVYTSLTAIGAVIGSLSYQQAIPVPEEEDVAVHVLVVALVATVLTSALCAVACAVVVDRVDQWTRTSGFSRYLWLVPLGVLGLGSYETVTQWAVRKKSFKIIARTSVERSLAQSGAQLAGGLAGLGSTALVVGQLVGQWVGGLRVLRKTCGPNFETLRAATLRGALAAAKRFRRFPFLSLPANLINALDRSAPPLLIAYFFGATITGYFALGQRALALPFLLVGSSAQKVFFAAGAEAKHAGRLAEVTESTLHGLLRLALPPVVIIGAAAPELFAVAFGSTWREAGVYTQWLSARTCFTIVAFPLTPLLFINDRQGAGFVFSVVQLVVRVATIVIGSRAGDARLAMMLLGVSTGGLWLLYLGYLWLLSGNRLAHGIRMLVVELSLALPLALPAIIVRRTTQSDWGVCLAALASALVAAGILLLRHQRKSPRAAL